MANGMGNNFGKNIGNGISNAVSKARVKASENANNKKQQKDVLNPEETNPILKENSKNAAKNALKALKNLAKLVAKAVKKLLSLGWVGLIILGIIIIAVTIIAFNNMPGMMKAKFKELFKIDTSGWFANGAVDMLEEDGSDIVNVLNYLESMEYNIIGDGFVTPRIVGKYDEDYILTKQELEARGYIYKKEDDSNDDSKYYFYDKDGKKKLEDYYIYYYDDNGKIISNLTGEPIENQDNTYTDKFGVIRVGEQSENSKGLIKGVSNKKDYRLVRTYLLSDYRIYNLKNADEDILTKIFETMSKVFGGNQDAWAKGLIKLYTAQNGIADGHWWWGSGFSINVAKFKDKTLSLQKGLFNNPMEFSVDGWSSRYGMSMDFLLSLHLGTHAPDLVYAMLQNFDTEVQVYLDDSGKSKVNSKYVDPNKIVDLKSDDAVTFAKIKSVLKNEKGLNNKIASIFLSDSDVPNLSEVLNNLALNKKVCQTLLKSDELNLVSPDNCLGAEAPYVLADSIDGRNPYTFQSNGENWLSKCGIKENPEDEYEARVFKEIAELDLKGYPNSANDFAEHIELEDPYTIGEVAKWDHARLWEGDFIQKYGYTAEAMFKEPTDQVIFPAYVGDGYHYWVEETVLNTEWETIVKGSDGKDETIEYEWKVYKYKIFSNNNKEEFSPYEDQGDFEWLRYVVDGKLQGIGLELFNKSSNKIFRDAVICEVLVKDTSFNESMIENSEYKVNDSNKCSNTNRKRCCPVCQKYVKSVIQALTAVSDTKYKFYIPYIARVVGSWFRDTYFVIPNEADAAINEYAGKMKSDGTMDKFDTREIDKIYPLDVFAGNTEDIEKTIISTNHPEVNLNNAFGNNVSVVSVDEEYLGDSGEYWSKYEMKKDASGNDTTEYQLYLLNADGSTSDIKMEQFLTDGKIGKNEKGKVNGKEITGYATKEEIEIDNWKKARERAEEDGWAFVKKIVVSTIDSLGQEGFENSDNKGTDLRNNLCWTAYSFDTKGAATEWEKVKKEEQNRYVNKLYDIIYKDKNNPNGDDNSGVFYQIEQTNNVIQQEDAQRSETNSLVKYLFKYRQYYIYDGSEERAVQIEHDKKRILYGYDRYVDEDYPTGYYNNKKLANNNYAQNITFGNENTDKNKDDANFYHYKGLISSQIEEENRGGLLVELYRDNCGKEYCTHWKEKVVSLLERYGRSAVRQTYTKLNLFDVDTEDLASQWLDWQLDMYYMNKFGVNLKSYYKTDEDLLKLKYDPRDPDLIGTIEITKSSLSVFSILENTGSIDAEYAYRDLKELIVELNYFDKEDLSQKFQTVFTWILPESNVYGWPNRPWDKQEVDYGALIQSCDTYDSLEEIEPSETGLDFIGYGDEELVVSPVTGKILEIGKHERLNVYSGEMEEVGYIIIQALNKEFGVGAFNNATYGYNYDSEKVGNYTNVNDALNLFYKEYKDVCAGYTVMIDGINVNLETKSESGKEGAYKKNKAYGIYNSEELKNREFMEVAKEKAPFYFHIGTSTDYPANEYIDDNQDSLYGYYVKEGKYIGKTMSNNSVTTEVKNNEVTETTESEEKTPIVDNQEVNETNTSVENKADYSKFAEMKSKNYIRMLVKDTDYAVVDDVENFFKRDGLPPFDGQVSEEFLYWMLVHCEGLSQSDAKSKKTISNSELDDGNITVAMGVTNQCNSYFKQLGYPTIDYIGQEVDLYNVRDVAMMAIEEGISRIQKIFPGRQFDEYQTEALISLLYNIGHIPDDIIKAIDTGNASTIKKVWSTYSDATADENGWDGLKTRRRAEVEMYFEKKYVVPGTMQEFEFNTDTPFTTYFETGENVLK